jgi:two-component system, OmpR family, response regulator
VTSALVLICDDSVVIRRLLEAVLGRAGLRVQSVASGAEALTAASETVPALVLLDMGLSGTLGGLEVAQALRAAPQTAQTPIIFITGSSLAPQDIAHLQPVAYLPKPFDPATLLQTVSTWLSKD